MTRKYLGSVAGVGMLTLLCQVASASAQAVAPGLGSMSPNAIVSETYTNSLNAGTETALFGNVCFTTGPGKNPVSMTSAETIRCTAFMLTDKNNALAILNLDTCFEWLNHISIYFIIFHHRINHPSVCNSTAVNNTYTDT